MHSLITIEPRFERKVNYLLHSQYINKNLIVLKIKIASNKKKSFFMLLRNVEIKLKL